MTSTARSPGSFAKEGCAVVKIVIYQPHRAIWFKNPVRLLLQGKSLPNKYGPLFNYLVFAEDIKLSLSTSLIAGPGWKGVFDAAFDVVHLLAWCVLNKVDLRRVKLVRSRKQLRRNDLLLLMHYGNLTHEQTSFSATETKISRMLGEEKIFKLVHMSHYMYRPGMGLQNLSDARPDLLVAENDLSKNSPFYRAFFDRLAVPFYTLPYAPAPRFKRTRRFGERTNKLVATGSITYKLRDPEFTGFFQSDELQPMRRILYDRSAYYSDQIDCLISDLNATRQEESGLTSISRKLKKLLTRLMGNNSQSAYYKKDIVNIYNSYAMFAVPEEICDLPGIGFVEGMACGAAYFGLDDPMYRDLGMLPGVHYVAYDGSPEDLVARIKTYQDDPVGLEQIANRGHDFVVRELSVSEVYGRLLNHIRLHLAKRPPTQAA